MLFRSVLHSRAETELIDVIRAVLSVPQMLLSNNAKAADVAGRLLMQPPSPSAKMHVFAASKLKRAQPCVDWHMSAHSIGAATFLPLAPQAASDATRLKVCLAGTPKRNSPISMNPSPPVTLVCGAGVGFCVGCFVG